MGAQFQRTACVVPDSRRGNCDLERQRVGMHLMKRSELRLVPFLAAVRALGSPRPPFALFAPAHSGCFGQGTGACDSKS